VQSPPWQQSRMLPMFVHVNPTGQYADSTRWRYQQIKSLQSHRESWRNIQVSVKKPQTVESSSESELKPELEPEPEPELLVSRFSNSYREGRYGSRGESVGR
jgi:hypothetical protein